MDSGANILKKNYFEKYPKFYMKTPIVVFLHCVKSVQIRSFSGPYFPVFGLNTGK